MESCNVVDLFFTDTNIVAAAAVDREFGCIEVFLELNSKCPGMLWGLNCHSLASLWKTFGVSLGTLANLGVHFGPSGATLGRLGTALGPLLGCLRAILCLVRKKSVRGKPHRKPMALKYRACAQKQTRWNLPGETVHELPFRTYLPHAPGIRMT